VSECQTAGNESKETSEQDIIRLAEVIKMVSVVVALRWSCERRPPPYPGRRSAHVRAVIMDSRIGLDYIVENPEYTAKLAGGECCWYSKCCQVLLRINPEVKW
jgi:hypothetical protein